MERIRDVRVAEELAAQAGTDATPELFLQNSIQPIIFAPQRPPLAASGYFPGTIGLGSGAVPLNTSHVGIFGSGAGEAIVRVNWLKIFNSTGGTLGYAIRRVDAPFTGFPSIRAVPGDIHAGNPATGRVFSVTKSDTVAAQGDQIAEITVYTLQTETVLGPWILNDGALVVACNTVNTPVVAAFGYESWQAIRVQPAGG